MYASIHSQNLKYLPSMLIVSASPAALLPFTSSSGSSLASRTSISRAFPSRWLHPPSAFHQALPLRLTTPDLFPATTSSSAVLPLHLHHFHFFILQQHSLKPKRVTFNLVITDNNTNSIWKSIFFFSLSLSLSLSLFLTSFHNFSLQFT